MVKNIMKNICIKGICKEKSKTNKIIKKLKIIKFIK